MKQLHKYLFVVLVAVALGGCGWLDDDDDDNDNSGSSGGGGGSGGVVVEGVFSDSPVSGLAYSSGDESGVTDENGRFTYNSTVSTRITFNVGGIEIGDGQVAAFMTPVDLVSDDDSSADDETHPWVTNIARFLQTIDDDGIPANGIQITQAIRDAAAGLSIDFHQSIDDFAMDPDVESAISELTSVSAAGTRLLVATEQAREHLRETLIARYEGAYSGTFQGSTTANVAFSGTWEVDIDDSGAITGTFASPDSPSGPITLPMTGDLPSNGDFALVANGLTFQLTFTGTLAGDGSVTGDWMLTDSGAELASGTFTGKRTVFSGGDDDGGDDGTGASCTVDGLDGHKVRFEITPNSGESYTVETCAAFECQTVGGFNCSLQVFDIAGSDRFFQFLTTDQAPFPVVSGCTEFDAVFDDDAVSGMALSIITQPTGRQFGVPDGTPFAVGAYRERISEFVDGDVELGTLKFFEYTDSDAGFTGFTIPTLDCDSLGVGQ